MVCEVDRMEIKAEKELVLNFFMNLKKNENSLKSKVIKKILDHKAQLDFSHEDTIFRSTEASQSLFIG